MTKKLLIPLVVFVVLVGFLFTGLFRDPREVPSPLIGKPAPTFTLVQPQDPAKTLGPTDLKGQVWLLNVWASWCVSCRDEHPLLVELGRAKIVPIVGLNYKDEPAAGLKWLAQNGDPYSVSVVGSYATPCGSDKPAIVRSTRRSAISTIATESLPSSATNRRLRARSTAR